MKEDNYEMEIDDEFIDEDAAKNGFGELTFEQANAAYEALYSDELTSDKKSELLLFWLFKFNDEFGRGDKDESDCPAEILARRAVVVQELIDRNISDNPVFAAELFRETGLFEKCVEILSALNNVDDSLARIAQQILSQAKNRNTRVFRLEM